MFVLDLLARATGLTSVLRSLQSFIIFFLPGLMLVNAAIVKLQAADAEAPHDENVHGGCVPSQTRDKGLLRRKVAYFADYALS